MSMDPVSVLLLLLLLTAGDQQQAVEAAFPAADSGEQRPDGVFISLNPQNVTTFLGRRIVLPCRVENLPEGVQPQWTQGGFGLGGNRSLEAWDRYRMIGENWKTDWDLEIRDVRLEDDNEYECQVAQEVPLRSNKAIVSVYVPPENPVIQGGVAVMEVNENQQVHLECHASRAKPAAELNWFDQQGDLIPGTKYTSRRMISAMEPDSKLFSATSILTLEPTRGLHNASFKCEAWNEAGRARPALVRLNVRHSPSVSVSPVLPSAVVAIEGEAMGFRCTAEANPPVQVDGFKWYIGDRLQAGQHGAYFEVGKVSRHLHGKQIKCSAVNKLGVGTGVRTIQVIYPPSFITQPSSLTTGFEADTMQLYCGVDSNPPARYYWTKGVSREVVSHRQNLSLTFSESTAGEYFCHAVAADFAPVTSRGAEVVMNAPPRISSPTLQFGELGVASYVNCASVSVPEPIQVKWMFYGKVLNDSNTHYRIVDSHVTHGRRSTLIITPTLETDFGTYTCEVKNSLGTTHIKIELESKQPFPLVVVLVSSFSLIILLLVTVIFLILFRRRVCASLNSKTSASETTTVACKTFPGAGRGSLNAVPGGNNNLHATNSVGALIKANNIHMDELSDASEHYKQELDSATYSNEADSAWEGSDSQDPLYGPKPLSNVICVDVDSVGNTTTTQQLRVESEPDFPPKPDIINNGYVPYGTYVREFNPPLTLTSPGASLYGTLPLQPTEIQGPGCPPGPCSNQVPVPQGSSSSLNVTDPRISATYANPYLRQATLNNHSAQYSTFHRPSPPAGVVASTAGSNCCSTFQPLVSGAPGASSTQTLNSLASQYGGLRPSNTATPPPPLQPSLCQKSNNLLITSSSTLPQALSSNTTTSSSLRESPSLSLSPPPPQPPGLFRPPSSPSSHSGVNKAQYILSNGPTGDRESSLSGGSSCSPPRLSSSSAGLVNSGPAATSSSLATHV